MVFGVSYQTLVMYIFIFIVGILFIAILASPLRKLLKVLLNCALGALALLIFNFIGNYFSFTIGLNPGSILTVGLLGIPGFILLVFLKVYLP
jgi:inhibitor of the pro-sigma K processing machinery